MVVESVKRYRRRRWGLLSEICGHNVPMCEQCGKVLHLKVGRLHVHHKDPEQGHGSGIGGWQHLLRVEEDLENDIEMEVLCHSCHAWEHNHEVFWTPEMEARS